MKDKSKTSGFSSSQIGTVQFWLFWKRSFEQNDHFSEIRKRLFGSFSLLLSKGIDPFIILFQNILNKSIIPVPKSSHFKKIRVNKFSKLRIWKNSEFIVLVSSHLEDKNFLNCLKKFGLSSESRLRNKVSKKEYSSDFSSSKLDSAKRLLTICFFLRSTSSSLESLFFFFSVISTPHLRSID